MPQEFINRPGWQCWPFWVLSLTPEASSSDVEKAARDISSKLNFGVEQTTKFLTPEGNMDRDTYLVRGAKSALQDPQTRLLAEFWYFDPEISRTRFQSAPAEKSMPSSEEDWLVHLGVRL